MMRIVAYTRSYQDGVDFATEKYPKWHVSIQHNGQGWQGHKWTVMLIGRKT